MMVIPLIVPVIKLSLAGPFPITTVISHHSMYMNALLFAAPFHTLTAGSAAGVGGSVGPRAVAGIRHRVGALQWFCALLSGSGGVSDARPPHAELRPLPPQFEKRT